MATTPANNKNGFSLMVVISKECSVAGQQQAGLESCDKAFWPCVSPCFRFMLDAAIQNEPKLRDIAQWPWR